MTTGTSTLSHARRVVPPHRYAVWALTMSLVAAGIWTIASSGPFVAAALVIGVVTLSVIVRLPWVGVFLLVASVPAQDFGAMQLGGQSLTLTRALFPLAVLGYALSLIVRRDPLRGTRTVVPFVAFVVVMLASIAWATSTSAAAAETGRWFTAITSFIILAHFLIGASQRRIMLLVGVMALAGVFQATYGVTQSVLALGPESFRVGDAASRAFGTFGQPNSYAGYLEMVFFPVFWVGVYVASLVPGTLREYRTSRLRGRTASAADRFRLLSEVTLTVALIAASVIILGGIGASYSRGAWLGVAAGGAFTVVFFHRWARRAALLLGAPFALLLVVGGLPGFVPDTFAERVTTGFADLRPFDAASVPVDDENFAAAERMAHWQAGWRMFTDEPLQGVGAGNFNERYDDYFVRQQFRFSRGHAHNYYVHVLAELGLVGLGAYVALIVSVLVLPLIVLIRSACGFERMLALGASGTIVSVLVHNVFENLHVLNLSIQLAAVWVLAIVAHRGWHATRQISGLE